MKKMNRKRCNCTGNGGLGIVRSVENSRVGQGLTMDPASSAGRRGSMCDGGRGACRRRDSESGRMRFRNYEDGTSDGGFLTGSVSDNGSRIKCGMTERACGTTKRGDSESGRSMVEMLGTLAIMGVLAIGGVAGYRWAMDKYRANDTIKELTQRALVYGQQMNAGSTTLSSAEFNPADTTKHGYGITALALADYPGYFEVELSEVPEAVCDAIVDSGWTLPVNLLVNNAEAIECAEGTANIMAFTFHKDLMGDALPEQSGGNENPEVSSGNPESIYSFGEPESPYSLSEPESPSLSDTETESTVSDSDSPYTQSDSNSPYTDSGSYWPEISMSESLFRECYSDSDCENNPNGNVCDSSGRCSPWGSCGENMFKNRSGSCYECSYSDYVWDTDAGECHRCTGDQKRFIRQDGYCYSCSYSYGVWNVDAGECARCDAASGYERESLGDYCVLKSKNANCTPDQFKTASGCQECSSTSWHGTGAYECHSCTGDNKRFMDGFGECWPCSTRDVVASAVEDSECARCNDTATPRKMVGGVCILENCDGFRDKDGRCYSCSDSASVYDVDADECEDACKDSGYEREINSSGYCVLKTCDGFRDRYGSCYSCSTSSGVLVGNTEAGKTECHRCTGDQQRFISKGGGCFSCSDSASVYDVDAGECENTCKDTSTPRYMNGSYCCPPKSLIKYSYSCSNCGGTWSNGKCS